jgi:ParB family transcriptional regulator, chromosome partitioning protein
MYKMDFKYKELDIKYINFENYNFLISYPLEDLELENSIKNFGIINPVILEREGDFYNIISGVKRLKIAKSLNMKIIPSYVLEFKNNIVSDFDRINLFLDDNLIGRKKDFNEIEKANLIYKLYNVFELKDEEIKIICKRIKFVISEFNINKKIEIYNLPKELKDKIIEKKFSLETAIDLMIFDQKIIGFILKIVDDLQINYNFSKEIIDNLKEIFKIYGLENKELFEKEVFDKIMYIFKSEDPKNLRFDKIKNFLDSKKNPNIFEQKKKFEIIKNFFEQEKNVKLNAFPYFEKEDFILNVNFKDKIDFLDLKETLSNLLSFLDKKKK